MNRTKFFVVLVFAMSAAAVFLAPTFTSRVSGTVLADAIGAPTNVAASDGDYIAKIQVSWDGVRGANLYRVFRNTTNNSTTAVDIGTTARSYYFDAPPTVGTPYFYWVRAENGGTVSQMSSGDQGVRANGEIISSPFFLLEPSEEPTGNPVTASKAMLGKALFWDEQLSSTNTVSCGTCHRPSAGGSDPRTLVGNNASRNAGPDNTFNTADDIFGSPGVIQNNANGTYTSNPLYGLRPQVTGRKSPSYLNAGYTRQGIFWDGRANDVFRDQITNNILLTEWAGLESQAAGPPLSSAEMAHTGRDWVQAAAKINTAKPLAISTKIPNGLKAWIRGRTYPQLFEEVFGTPDVTPSRIAMAIGTHERSIFSDRTPLDRAIQNIEPLTASELAGMTVFQDMNCAVCHAGSLLSDNNFHNIGVRPWTEDIGREAVTMNPDDKSRFKTPGLRNVELRGPYFHNGGKATLEEVIELYRLGGEFAAPNINTDVIHPLNMTMQQRADLAAFMRRPLTDPRVANELPPFDRPKLFTETNRVPVVSGTGRNGTGGITPTAIAIEPPFVGNAKFTVGVSGAIGGANAVLVIDSADPGIGSTIPASGSLARIATTLAGSGGGNGTGSAVVAIPNNLSLVGNRYFGRWYVTDAGATNGFSVSSLITFSVFSTAIPSTQFDFDGDSKTDIGIYRPNGVSGSEWWYQKSSNGGSFATQFGAPTDKVVAADYTGDGKTDIAFWRPTTGYWYVLRSEDLTYYALPFGSNGDVPVSADYDADGKADIGIFRASAATWYVQRSGDGGTTIQGFGVAGDVPVNADYDGDGKTDFAIYRPSLGQWWLMRSSAGTVAYQFGTPTDKTVVGDYTGDGKADVAFWRPASGEWFVLRSEDNSFYGFPFGISTDTPVPGDYDGDGRNDAGVFRSSNNTWYINRTTAGTLIQQFGSAGDMPLPNAYVR